MGNKKKPLGHRLPLHLAGAAIKKFETEPADVSQDRPAAERSVQAALTRNAAAGFGLICYADGTRRWGFASAVPDRSGRRGRTAHVHDETGDYVDIVFSDVQMPGRFDGFGSGRLDSPRAAGR